MSSRRTINGTLVFPMMMIFALTYFSASAQEKKEHDNRYGVFDGRTPCQELASQIKEKPGEACFKIKWRLMLYEDAVTHQPTTFSLQGFVFKKDTPLTGTWRIEKGMATDPSAIVYRLDANEKPSFYFLKGDDNVLFFLDSDKKLLVGNKDFSFTLNRMEGVK